METGFVVVPRLDDQQRSESRLEHLPDIDLFIHDLETSLWPLNCRIHDNPELGFKEYKTHDALTKFMKSHEGWHVTPSAYGMETAWLGVYDTGRPGPVVSFNAEMDALPGLGHACGHNLIAMVSVAAALATADVLRRHSLPGKVVIMGTPAEENGGGGKIKCLEAGAYKDVDVSLISHPGIVNNSPLVRTTAYTHLNFTFRGRAAHAARAPWLGVNALDALVIAYNAVSALRQQTRPDDIIGLQITDGGNKPNVIHEHAAAAVLLRASTASRLRELQRKIEACFRGGAEATGATFEIEVLPGYLDHLPNRVLGATCRRYWKALPDMPDPPPPPPGQPALVVASTDQGNVSYALPSMNFSFAIPPGVKRGQPHSPDFERASSTRGAFDRAMRVAKSMAGTAVDIYTVPGLLDEIKQEWQRNIAEQDSIVTTSEWQWW